MNPVDLDGYTTAVDNLITTLRGGARRGKMLAVDEVIAELAPMIDDEDVASCCWGMIVSFSIALQRLVLSGADPALTKS